jgi:3-hydroxyacyl-CoA dehydrogenase
MARKVDRVAVLGAGVMGTGIAAHLAGAGLDVLLLDIIPPELTAADEAKGLTRDDRVFRNRFATSALQRALKAKPEVFHDPDDAGLIATGNFDDDLARICDCDWIVEVVTENLAIKRKLFAKIDEHRRPGALVTSNTSGLSIAGMVEGRSDDFVANFFVTHFFNPVRYMRLLELVPGDRTDDEAIQFMARFGADTLGKGIVFGKDTPNFVANRIGTFGLLSLLHAMARDGFTVEELDALFGKPMGRPKSAVFRTADIVGLDTLMHVADNCHETLVDDEKRDTFEAPEFLRQMVARGWLGQKSGQGFYKKVGKEILALDIETFEYKPKAKVRADSIGAVRKIDDPGARVKKLLEHDDRLAKLAWETTAQTLVYTARRVGEIADDVVNIDNALKWGFNWEQGPFELWDAIGVRQSVERMEREGIEVPDNVHQMLSRGVESFYGGSRSAPTIYDFASGEHQAKHVDPRHISLPALEEQQRRVAHNASASVYDIGDGVLCIEFHSKMNAIDADIITVLNETIDRAENEGYAGVVIGNHHPQAFCAGANLFAMLIAARQKQWQQIEEMIAELQRATMRMRQSRVPVVTAVAGLALGGGAEVAMGADVTRCHAETYMGLVEVGVGLIPAGGGCWALLERFCGGLPDDPAVDPMPSLRPAFMNIAMAKVATGAENARKLGFLRPMDQVSFDRDLLLHDAKQTVLGMSRAGYRKPRPLNLRLPGPNGAASFRWAVADMLSGKRVTEHEAKIAGKLATILTGGETSTRVKIGQERILELEREAFLSLVGEAKTQERMQHMLQNGKPLRN